MLELKKITLSNEIIIELLKRGYKFTEQSEIYSYYTLEISLDGIDGIVNGSVEIKIRKNDGISIYTQISLHRNVSISDYCRLSLKIDVEVINLLLLLGC